MPRIKLKKTVIVLLLLAAGGGWYYYSQKKSAEIVPDRYVFGEVSRGPVIASVSGTGLVSASSQIDIKPKISAEIKEIKVVVGQKVKTGDIIAILDDKDLVRSVNQAKNSLASAQASLNLKLAGPAKEEIEVSKKSVESARISYENSLVNQKNAERTAQENLKKAELQLANSKLSLENAERQYQDALSNKNINNESSNQDLTQAYDNAKNTLNTSLLSMRNAISAARNIIYTENYSIRNLLGITNSQYLSEAKMGIEASEKALSNFENDYNKILYSMTPAEEEDILNKMLAALKTTKDMEHSVYNVLANTITSTDLSQSTLDGYKSTISSQESTMVSSMNSIQSAQQSISDAKLKQSSSNVSTSGSISSAKNSLETAKNNLTSSQNNLDQVKLDNEKSIASAQVEVNSKKLSYESSQAQFDLKVAKPRAVDLESARVQIAQAQISYQEALDNLSNAKVVSPIDGMIAEVSQSTGDTTSGTAVSTASTGTVIATVITTRQLATITLNEVDVAKVQVGQKATVTFNAIEDLTITGEVVEVGNIGTVSQGVVNYSVKIAFDTQDSRIKSQMSVSASIVVAENLDAVKVANSAIKSDSSGRKYVETSDEAKTDSAKNENGIVLANGATKKYVDVGISNDTETEITNGLAEGDLIIIKTISNKTSSTSASSRTGQNSALRMISGGGGPR